MSDDLVCPKCGEAFRDEDYCPRHGVRLVRPVDASQPVEEPNTVDAIADEIAITQPTLAAETDGDQERESKIARFFEQFRLRPVPKKARLSDGEAMPTCASSAGLSSPLPDVVTEQGWQLAGPVQSNPAVDRWPVDQTTESGPAVAGHFHRFRTGALTTDAIYRRLEERTTPRLARVWTHGTVDLAGARADYELVSLPKPGISLDKWFADSTPSEQRASRLFPVLVELLLQLARASIQPLTFDPTQLVLTHDGELWLGTAAALMDVSAENAFRPELERSPLLPHGWTAPELTEEGMASANAALFSLGQVLALAIWGQPCSIGELNKGAVPFASLSDARLARVLMGCLWPRSSGRWTLEDSSCAVSSANADAVPGTPPWDSLVPGASSTAFGFAGASFWRLEDLLAAAVQPAHWNEAIARLDAILDWAEGTAWAGQSKLMRDARAQGRSADWVLVALTRAVRPEAPLTWRALDLSDDEAARSLIGLAQRALHGSQADVDAMRELFKADLRGAFRQTPPKS